MNNDDNRQTDLLKLKENAERMEKIFPYLLEMKDNTVSIKVCQENILLDKNDLLSLLWYEWNKSMEELVLMGVDITHRRLEGGKA
jgi:hypothetical protein